jgi:hypothetical protein
MHGYETETHIGRYIGKMQWLMPFVGFGGTENLESTKETNLFGRAAPKTTTVY